MAAKKFDGEKTMWHACPWKALEHHAKVMTFGARKYGLFNYLEGSGLDADRYFSAAMRHILARKNGEFIDPESGEPHLAHGASCILMWLETDIRNRK